MTESESSNSFVISPESEGYHGAYTESENQAIDIESDTTSESVFSGAVYDRIKRQYNTTSSVYAAHTINNPDIEEIFLW